VDIYIQILDLEKRLASMEDLKRKGRRTKKKQKQKLIDKSKMMLQEMFDGMTTETWDEKKNMMATEKKNKE
jgi:hypothetical protein